MNKILQCNVLLGAMSFISGEEERNDFLAAPAHSAMPDGGKWRKTIERNIDFFILSI